MKTSKTSYIKALAQSLYPYRVKLSWGLASAGMAAAFDVAGPILLKIGIDFLQQSESIGWLYISTGSILLAAALAGFFRYFGRLNVISVSRFAECDIRNTFFNHFLKLSPTFYDQNQTGDMMARATEDLERVRMVLGPALLYIVNTILILIFSAIMMFMLDSIMACVVIGLAPILAIVVFFVAKRLHEANIEQQTAYSSLSSQVQENLSGFRVVKAFVREDHESRKFADVCHEYFLKSMKVAKVQALFMPLLGTIVGFGIAAILWMGGNRIVLGEMTLGSFIAFMSYLSLMTWPMIALGWMTHLYQRGGASHFRIKEMLKIPPQFDSEGINKSIENAFAPEIVFNEVTLTYENRNTETLSKVSLTIKSNSTIAIVGQVGSGKSSLVRLIPRLYEPNEGNILLNGTDIKDLCVDDLRKSVGYVDQSLFLFSASIRENIAKGRIEASLEEIIQSARDAGLDEEILSFPDGYDTIIGERGVTLSGGQQQRLTLARALLIDPSLLILDDALSAVDSDKEAEILANFGTREKGRTVLFVTHRLSAAKKADRIIVLENGKIVEDGIHNSLIDLGGLYYKMYSRQKLTEKLMDMG